MGLSTSQILRGLTMRQSTGLWQGNLKGTPQLGDIGIHGRIVLQLIPKESGGRV
jgi:hypothetical protein